MQQAKDDARARFVERTLGDFGKGIVVVEGNHDFAALKQMGIKAITYHQLLATSGAPFGAKIAYLLMDLDKGGEEKKRKLESFLHEKYPECVINTTSGSRLLKALNVTSTEQIVKPVIEVRQRANGAKAKIDKKNWR